MSEEMKNEICKAFVYGVPLEDICENTGLSKDEVMKFYEENKEKISDIATYRKKLEE